ncbi:MAG: hypothetical protein EOP10_27500, partial [Proteobacteria bacterium]
MSSIQKSVARVSLVLLISLASSQCASVKGDRNSESKATKVPTPDFCDIKGLERSPYLSTLWGAETVSYQIGELIQDSNVYGTPWMSYPVAYRRMTAARDIARCSGTLKAADKVDVRINHLLSDIMTRWYVLTVKECAASGATLGTNAGFCPLMKKMKAEKYDSLSAAMSSTAVYISSHISLALSAIAFDDAFWDETGLEQTYNNGKHERVNYMAARIAILKRYKPSFDAFNAFLANNLTTVGSALKEAKLLSGDVLNFAAGLSRVIPFRALAFGKIRDDAFANALMLVDTLTPEDHPMIRTQRGRSYLNYGHFNFDFVYPEKTRAVEASALFNVANSANMEIYRRLLGGKSWDQVQKELKP